MLKNLYFSEIPFNFAQFLKISNSYTYCIIIHISLNFHKKSGVDILALCSVKIVSRRSISELECS